MSRALVTLYTRNDRERAIKWIDQAPLGTRVEMKQAKRSLDQNSKMWACLTDIASQVRWHGVKLSPEDFKFVFLDALKREMRLVPNLDGTGFVNVGRSSSDLSKSEMSDLIEIAHAFGAQHGVVFHDQDSHPSELTQQAPRPVVQARPAADVPPPSVAGRLLLPAPTEAMR